MDISQGLKEKFLSRVTRESCNRDPQSEKRQLKQAGILPIANRGQYVTNCRSYSDIAGVEQCPIKTKKGDLE